MKIVNWVDIKGQFLGGDILIGNGVSIDLSQKFAYKSIYTAAQDCMSKDLKRFFDVFKTQDFEEVLNNLKITQDVMFLMKYDRDGVSRIYEEIKQCFIDTILSCHADYGEVASRLEGLGVFLSNFKTVLNLNYDLLVYWAMLLFNRKYNEEKAHFKDGFKNGHFMYSKDEAYFLTPKGNTGKVTMVFYPHGNLCLFTDDFGTPLKISKRFTENLRVDLLKLFNDFKNGQTDFSPLFVSEGTSKQKEFKIKCNADYLFFVYNTILTEKKDSLLVLGSSFDKNDDHIFQKIHEFSDLKRIAVSFHDSEKAGERWNRIRKLFPSIKKENVFMFDYREANLFDF